jgi:CDP-diacylglycerol--glycerol-3-phosphate 3-phosphatidyltransferase
MNIKIPLNIPNLLSLYRLFAFPFVFYLALNGYERAFSILICINLITDILDGWIARRFNMMTEIGARLDSIADFGTYILAFTGIYCFKLVDFQPHLVSFSIFLGLFVSAYLLSVLKFGRLPSLHLYSSKICGYIQGFFFFTLFVFGFNTPFYYFMVITGILSLVEHISVQLSIKEMKSNAKGLYWVLKEKK